MLVCLTYTILARRDAAVLLLSLFLLPIKSVVPPQCKSSTSRRAAFMLLRELVRECSPALAELFSQIMAMMPPEEMMGEDRWNILPEDARRSTYVGLMNLGMCFVVLVFCVCCCGWLTLSFSHYHYYYYYYYYHRHHHCHHHCRCHVLLEFTDAAVVHDSSSGRSCPSRAHS